MQINGVPATSGTIVIAPGEIGSIPFPGIGEVPLHFKTDGGANRVEVGTNGLEFFNTDNVLGVALTPTISIGGQPDRVVRIAVYAMGEPNFAMRVVHYTYC
jgi:hypothetical protein